MTLLHQQTCPSWDIANILQTCHLDCFGYDVPHPPQLIIPTCRKVWCYLHVKNQLHLSLLSWDIGMILQTCYFWYFGDVWLWPPKRMVLACRRLWCVSSCNKWNISLASFLKYCQDIANFLFWLLWAWLCPSKLIKPAFRKVWCLSTSKKSTSSLPSFLRYCNDITNLLFLVYLRKANKRGSINLQETLMIIYIQKINFIPLSFLEILHFKEFCNLIGWEQFGP